MTLAHFDEARRGARRLLPARFDEIRSSAPLANAFLIETLVQSEFRSTHCRHGLYQNSNRYKTALSVLRPSHHSPSIARPLPPETWLFDAPGATLLTSNKPWQTRRGK